MMRRLVGLVAATALAVAGAGVVGAVVVDGNAVSSPVPSSVPKLDSKH